MKKNQKITFNYDAKRIVYSALFIALSFATNSLDITAGTMTITLTYTFAFLASIFMGPLSGGLIAGIGDLLGAFVKGFAPNPIILLASFVMGIIPGLLFKLKRVNKYLLIAISYVLVFIICTCIINTTAFYIFFNRSGRTFLAILVARLATQNIVLAVNVFVTYALYTFLSKTVFKDSIYAYKDIRYRMPMAKNTKIVSNTETI